MVISINKIRLVCYKCNMHFLLDCHQMLRLYLWWSGVKHSSCSLSKTKFTGWEDGVFGTSERDMPPFILKMPVVKAIKRICTHISAMQYPAWSHPYTVGVTLNVLSEHFTWENGEVIYIIYIYILDIYHQQMYIFFQTCLFAYYKIVRFLQQEKVLWYFPGAHSSVCVDCLSRKISRPQAVNEYSQGGTQATGLAPGAHACMFLY